MLSFIFWTYLIITIILSIYGFIVLKDRLNRTLLEYIGLLIFFMLWPLVLIFKVIDYFFE